MEEETKLLPAFPYSDLVKIGFVKSRRKAVEKVVKYLKGLGE